MSYKRLNTDEINQIIDAAKRKNLWNTLFELERELSFTDEEISLMSDSEKSSIFLDKNADKSITSVVKDLIFDRFGSTHNIIVASAVLEIRLALHREIENHKDS